MKTYISLDSLSSRKIHKKDPIQYGVQITQLGFRCTLFLGVLLLIIALIPETNASAAKKQAKTDVYMQAQNEFVSDISKGKHHHAHTEANKCKTINPDTKKPFSIAALVYAFAFNESHNGTEGQSVKTNNWTSIHPKGSYYYVWDGVSKSNSEESIRIYKNPKDGLKDTMYLLKYGYGCNVTWNHVAYYIYGKGPYNKYVPHLGMTRSAHVTIYRDKLLEKAKSYEKSKKK